MKVSIRARNIVLSAKLKKTIAERVGLSLGGFADRIALVLVSIIKPVDAAGAVPTACRVEVTITRKIKVEAAHTDPLEAVNAALESATRKVARMLRQETVSDDLKPMAKRRARM